jgi:predicted dehydrogenase
MLAALANGKHVLCEKPLTLNAAEAIEVAIAAKAANRLVMEALFSRFIPSMIKVREILASGKYIYLSFVSLRHDGDSLCKL